MKYLKMMLATGLGLTTVVSADIISMNYVPSVVNQVNSAGTAQSQTTPLTGLQNGLGFQTFMFFELADFSAGETVSGADFSMDVRSILNNVYDTDLYLYGANTLGAGAGDYQVAPGTPGSGDNPANFVGSRVADDFVTSASSNGDVFEVTDGDLTIAMQGLYGGDHIADFDYAVFRLQADWDTLTGLPTDTIDRFTIESSSGIGTIPTLSIDTMVVPEPSSLAMIGIGLMGLLVRNLAGRRQ